MQFRKPLHIFLGYVVRLRNEFKAIVIMPSITFVAYLHSTAKASPINSQYSIPRFSSTRRFLFKNFAEN